MASHNSSFSGPRRSIYCLFPFKVWAVSHKEKTLGQSRLPSTVGAWRLGLLFVCKGLRMWDSLDLSSSKSTMESSCPLCQTCPYIPQVS